MFVQSEQLSGLGVSVPLVVKCNVPFTDPTIECCAYDLIQGDHELPLSQAEAEAICRMAGRPDPDGFSTQQCDMLIDKLYTTGTHFDELPKPCRTVAKIHNIPFDPITRRETPPEPVRTQVTAKGTITPAGAGGFAQWFSGLSRWGILVGAATVVSTAVLIVVVLKKRKGA